MAIKTLVIRIASIVFFIGVVIICVIIIFRRSLVLYEHYSSNEQKVVDEVNEAMEDLTIEELNKAF